MANHLKRSVSANTETLDRHHEEIDLQELGDPKFD